MTTTATRERPILFSSAMVRAILDGRKTQTRRVVSFKKYPEHATLTAPKWAEPGCSVWINMADPVGGGTLLRWCPYGQPGSKLWIRESAYIAPADFGCGGNVTDDKGRLRVVGYAADMDSDSVRCATDYGVKKTPSIHMPRWASRLTLEVVSVKVERVQDISDEDTKAEGIESVVISDLPALGDPRPLTVYRRAFGMLWNSINSTRGFGWDANPWVWVVEFRRAEQC